MKKEYVLRVQMNASEKASFAKAFKKSGFKSMGEFVRFMIRQYTAAMGNK